MPLWSSEPVRLLLFGVVGVNNSHIRTVNRPAGRFIDDEKVEIDSLRPDPMTMVWD